MQLQGTEKSERKTLQSMSVLLEEQKRKGEKI